VGGLGKDGLKVFVSADGVHWKEMQKELGKILLSIHVPPIHLKREAVKWLIAWSYHRQIIEKD
jgi:hypothetical protein